MSERRGVFIGECGHLVPIEASGRVIIACACDRPTVSSRRPRPDYVAQLCAAVEDLARARDLLVDLIELADEVDADTITDEQLRTRLVALADRARRWSPGSTARSASTTLV